MIFSSKKNFYRIESKFGLTFSEQFSHKSIFLIYFFVFIFFFLGAFHMIEEEFKSPYKNGHFASLIRPHKYIQEFCYVLFWSKIKFAIDFFTVLKYQILFSIVS